MYCYHRSPFDGRLDPYFIANMCGVMSPYTYPERSGNIYCPSRTITFWPLRRATLRNVIRRGYGVAATLDNVIRAWSNETGR